MSVNLSESCATRKILQCRDLGLEVNDISQKFSDSRGWSEDLHEDLFKERKRVLSEVQAWMGTNMHSRQTVLRNQWIPILYNFEVSRSRAS